jgi:crotonobetainyl-CoA:carnitine CoA-transferase CaiB-like acyl-CoA transferase
MFETMAQFVLGDHMGGLTFEPPIGPSGYARILDHNRRPHRTRDGYLCVLFYNDKQWRKFFELVGQPDLMDKDPRFATIGERTKHIDALYRMVAEVMPTRTTAEWIEILEAADMPVMQLHTIDTLLADPHLGAVGFFDVVEHPTEGAIRSMAIPSVWSKSSPQVSRQAPRLGEHSAEVLAEAGYSAEDIRKLAASGTTMLAS